MQVLITVTEQIDHERVVEVTEEEYYELYKDYMGGDMFGSFMQESDTSCSNTTKGVRSWKYGEVRKLEYKSCIPMAPHTKRVVK